MARNDKNVYVREDNGRYRPIGVCENLEYLTDGLWYVSHTEHSNRRVNCGYLSGLFHISEAVRPPMNQLMGLEDYCQEILEDEDFQFITRSGYSLNDVVHFAVGKVFEINKKLTTVKKDV